MEDEAGVNAEDAREVAVLSDDEYDVDEKGGPDRRSSATSSGAAQWNYLLRASKAIELLIAKTCARLAVACAASPARTIWACVIIAIGCGMGWILLDDENQVEKLYTPQRTRAFADRDWVEDRFGDADAVSLVYLNRENGKTNLFDKDALLELFDLYDLALSIDSEKHTRGYDTRSCAQVFWASDVFTDRGTSADLLCQKESILAFWAYNRTRLEADPDPLATINANVGVAEDCCSPSSRTIELASIAAKLEYAADGRTITGAGALRLAFYLEQSLNERSRSDPHARRLENKFDRRIRGARWAYFQNPIPVTQYGIDTNSDAAFDGDRLFINIAIFIIIAYAFLALYDRKRPERSRGVVGLYAVLTVVISTLAAFGLAILSGVGFSPSTGVAVFLVLGIGLDDSFVICGLIDDDLDEEWYDPTRSPLENDADRVLVHGESVEAVTSRRIIHTLRSSGPSITVTSITDTAAFIGGSFTETPDISNFNRFCAAAVMVDFAFQLTLFVALLTYDQRNRLKRKLAEIEAQKTGDSVQRGCCSGSRCCVKTERAVRDAPGGTTMDDAADADVAPEVAAVESSSQVVVKAKAVDDDDDDARNLDEASARTAPLPPKAPGAASSRAASSRAASKRYIKDDDFWGGPYADVLLSWPGRIFVLSATAVVFAMAVVGASRVRMDIEDNWNVVEGVPGYNYVRKGLDFEQKHFARGATEWVGLYTKRADYYESRDDMRRLIDDYADEHYVVTASLETNWFDAHQGWLDETGQTVSSSEEYLASLRTYLAGDGIDYAHKVLIDDRGVYATEIDSLWEDDDVTGGIAKRRMRKAREQVRKSSGDLGTVIVYNNGFVWYESFAVIARSTIFAMLIACVTVFIVLIFLLGDLLAAVLVAMFVTFTCLVTFGSINLYSDDLNYITSFFIVIAVGLSTDAPAHICHTYLESRDATRSLRARESLSKLGPSVFRGGISTILGIAVTGFCVTYIFEAFFAYLMTILILALWNGLALMPVVCSLIGPMPTHDIIVHA